VQRYFETIGEIWVQRSGEMARAIAVGLYPDAISEAAVAAADRFLADTSVPPALRRLVSEGCDDVRRALHARGRDAARTDIVE
jgi:aminopeptidase N